MIELIEFMVKAFIWWFLIGVIFWGVFALGGVLLFLGVVLPDNPLSPIFVALGFIILYPFTLLGFG